VTWPATSSSWPSDQPSTHSLRDSSSTVDRRRLRGPPGHPRRRQRYKRDRTSFGSAHKLTGAGQSGALPPPSSSSSSPRPLSQRDRRRRVRLETNGGAVEVGLARYQTLFLQRQLQQTAIRVLCTTISRQQRFVIVIPQRSTRARVLRTHTLVYKVVFAPAPAASAAVHTLGGGRVGRLFSPVASPTGEALQ